MDRGYNKKRILNKEDEILLYIINFFFLLWITFLRDLSRVFRERTNSHIAPDLTQ